MKKYFFIDESPVYKEKFLIRLDHNLFDKFFPTGISGSFNILIARVCGLSYANYLRYVRDTLGAEVLGKNSKYPVAFFDRSDELTQFVKMLNKKMELIEYTFDHPYDIIEEDEKLVKTPILFEEK